uniref:Ovule protein n=1 Tax=Ascaris lumbricoides TaxID=6252 RepID=A0A0M3I0R9_ASCLU
MFLQPDASNSWSEEVSLSLSHSFCFPLLALVYVSPRLMQLVYGVVNVLCNATWF